MVDKTHLGTSKISKLFQLPDVRADDALLALSFSLSLPWDLERALANPFWSVECQEWGRDFFTLARPRLSLEKKEEREVSVSAGLGVFSFLVPYWDARENISMLIYHLTVLMVISYHQLGRMLLHASIGFIIVLIYNPAG